MKEVGVVSNVAPMQSGKNAWLVWWPVLMGLAVLYLPTWWKLANGIWQSSNNSGGPEILAVSLFLIWKKRSVLISSGESARPIFGWMLLILGLLVYTLGRSQDIVLLEIGSQIPVLFGVLLVSKGLGATRSMLFPIAFLVFMLPLPGYVVDQLTGPLKQYVSLASEDILYTLGYPIARSGVTISIGQYQLFVADACSGLHSIFSLSALGLLYLYLMHYRSRIRNLVILASILPIAVGANIIRVIVLILITYYLGDEVGQGFAHEFTGMTLFVFALLFLFSIDKIIGLFSLDD